MVKLTSRMILCMAGHQCQRIAEFAKAMLQNGEPATSALKTKVVQSYQRRESSRLIISKPAQF